MNPQTHDYTLNTLYSSVKSWFGFSKNVKTDDPLVRAKAAATQLAFYEGNAPRQLVVKPNAPDDNVFVNYPQMIVDKGVSFLFGDGVKILIGTKEDVRGEKYLSDVWSDEKRAVDLIEAATDGGIFGDAWLKIRINEAGKPEVRALDPQHVRVEADAHDYLAINKYVCQYEGLNSDGKTIRFKEETSLENGRWIIREFEAMGRNEWTQRNEINWNYSFAPVFHCKNLPHSQSFYGAPDLSRSVLMLCNYISRLDSMIGKIIRVHSSPKAVASGFAAGQDLNLGGDSVLFLPLAEQKLELIEMTGDLQSALAFRKQLRECLAEISHVPELSTSKTESIGNLSGRALKILYSPLIDQTKKKQRLYGSMIRAVVVALLEIGNLKELTDEVSLQWIDPIPTDAKEDADIGIALKQIGVSEDTILRRLGFDPEHEREMSKENSDALGDALGRAFDAGETDSGIYDAPPPAKTEKTDDTADDIAKRVTAAGALIRAGFDPQAALKSVGLDPIKHLGLLPVTLQQGE